MMTAAELGYESAISATLLIAHEHALFRAAVRAGLEHDTDLTVVGHAVSARQAIGEADRLRPSVALIDSELPPDGGVPVCTAIKDLGIPTRVLLMCNGGDQGLLLQALEAGADGYVRHEGGLSEVAAGCHAAARGEAFVPPRLLAPLLRGLIVRQREESAVTERLARLSRREKEILGLLVSGHDQRSIAEMLVISPATARTHLQNVLRKLEVHSRLEATALALRHNFVPALSPRGLL
jgi:DNA-binding NarL/FixJ family response regulator